MITAPSLSELLQLYTLRQVSYKLYNGGVMLTWKYLHELKESRDKKQAYIQNIHIRF